MKAILAYEEDGGIGYKNTLPWGRIDEDMKHFVNITRGKTVVMGSSTFESLGFKPLPKRKNIVLSRDPNKQWDGVEVMTLDVFLNSVDVTDVVIIGGANIYDQLIPQCDEVFITEVKGQFQSDTFMCKLWIQNQFEFIEELLDTPQCTIKRYSN